MAKSKKALILMLLVFVVLGNIPVYAEQVNIPSIFSSYGIWNEAYSDFVTTTSSNTESIINWANAEFTPTNITVGFNFDMLPNITYSVQYHLHSNNGTRFKWLNTSRGDPVAVYSNQDMLSGLPYSSYEDVLFNEDNLIASSTVYNSSVGVAPYDVTFITYLKSSEYLSGFESSYKYITFRPDVTDFDPADASYRISFSTLNIYYDPNDISEETLVQLNEQVEALKELGIKVDLTNTLLENLTEEVTKGLEDVEKAVENVGEDVANNIAKLDKDEASKADKDVLGITEQFKDFEYSIDFNDIKNVYSSFWDALSSTDVCTSLTIEGFEFKGHTLWTTQTVDFSRWINHPLISLLLGFVQIFIAIKLIVWVVEFWYVLIQFFVGNWDGSMSDILYKYNPFT